MNKGITIAGNILTDTVKLVSTYPQLGKLADIYDVKQAVGGCVPNTIIDLAMMQGDIPLKAAGRIGCDEAGRFVTEALKKAEVNTDCIIVSQTKQTSFSDAMSAVDSGERTFFHYRGANAEFSPDDLPADQLDCSLLHIGYILLLDAFDAPDDEYGTVMSRYLHDVQGQGIRTSIDVVSGEQALFQEKVIPALRYCDYAIMNEIEGGAVAGLDVRDQDGRLIVDNIVKTLEFMMAQGVKRRVVLHCPEAGFCLDSDEGLFIEPSYKLPKDYIKGSVGAGDAFCAGCLYAVYHEKDPRWMLRYAAAAAAANLSAADSVSGMKSNTELQKMMNEWEVNQL